MFRYGLMGPFMKDGGKRTKLMARVELFMQTEILTKVSGKITKIMVSEFTAMLMDLGLKATGKMIDCTEMVQKPGMMVPSTKDST